MENNLFRSQIYALTLTWDVQCKSEKKCSNDLLITDNEELVIVATYNNYNMNYESFFFSEWKEALMKVIFEPAY